ncbi:hypothetical protein PR202_gb05757 [Eleusine coracana subsp. coracana]|uniref:Uncharacterized protein n=1 Tax=Eleusine coracana subsp. coracana TaxID=191504 RepID=A0AAV5E7U5_ELECO|nr:hypothetical protein PR202_gb05757 [Eleusine coracana subsp. coracana]
MNKRPITPREGWAVEQADNPNGDEAWSCAEPNEDGFGGGPGAGLRAARAAAVEAAQVTQGRVREEEVKERKRTRGSECADFSLLFLRFLFLEAEALEFS